MACEGCTLKFSNPAHTGLITILPVGGGSSGSNAGCGGNQVYRGVAFTCTACSNGAGIINGTGAGSISGTAVKVKVSAQPPVRKGDSVTITIVGTSGGSPASYSSTIEVDDPGQSKAKAV
jgi:hypothetical protein